jgi:hypothetical protein
MTDTEWHSTADVDGMLLWLMRRRKRLGFHPERFRTLAVACARRVWPYLPDEVRAVAAELERGPGIATGVWAAFEVETEYLAERVGEGVNSYLLGRLDDVDAFRRLMARQVATGAAGYVGIKKAYDAVRHAAERAARAAYLSELPSGTPFARLMDAGLVSPAERAAQAGLVRCVFGDAVSPVAFDPAWRTEAVVALARGIDEGDDFATLPVLADALDDAGCGDAGLIAHGRGPGPHARGCHVVDRVLGRW